MQATIIELVEEGRVVPVNQMGEGELKQVDRALEGCFTFNHDWGESESDSKGKS